MGFYQPNGFTIDDFAATPVKVVSGGPDVKGIKIAVPAGGVVSGRITGSGGGPIAGALVTAGPLGFAPNSILPRSGIDGRYTITGIPTNEYRVAVQAPVGSDYLSGYFEIGQPGHFTRDFEQATNVRVFEDRDRTAPAITFRDPAAGAMNVSVQPEIAIRFSEPVDNATTSTITLKDPRGRSVPATVTFTPIERTARLTPSVELLPGTKYKLTLTSAIVDWSGNHFAGASWSFTTSP
jgi:hypothetical protein